MIVAQQQTVDVIYLNNGQAIKGKIVSGGKNTDYYVQIKTETDYINVYMSEVREIKRNQAAGIDLPTIKTVDIVYLNNGKIIKGKITGGGEKNDYYVQILVGDEYQNIYMRDVELIQSNQKDKKQLTGSLEKEKNKEKIKTGTRKTSSSNIQSPDIKELDVKKKTTHPSSFIKELDVKKKTTQPSSLTDGQGKTEEDKKDTMMGIIFGSSWGFPGEYNIDTIIRLSKWHFGYSMGLSDKLGANEITIGKNIGKIRANIIMGSQHIYGYKYDEMRDFIDRRGALYYDYKGGSISYSINSLLDINVGLIGGNEDVHEGLQLYMKCGIHYEF